MTVQFVSLRQFRDELLGVRLSAANQSLWNLGAEAGERARGAFNDAVNSYPIPVQSVYHSATVTPGNPIVLPRNVERVTLVQAIGSSVGGYVKMTDLNHVPTIQTNLLYVNNIPFGVDSTKRVDVHFEANFPGFSPDVAINEASSDTATAVAVTGGNPSQWPVPGYFEVTPVDVTATKLTSLLEVVRYEAVGPTGFSRITRAVSGHAFNWTEGDIISHVVPLPQKIQPTIKRMAEANMYDYWVAHRAQYTRFAAAAGIQQLDIPDVLAISRSFEEKAARLHKRNKKAPSPGRVRRKGRRT